MYARPLMEKFGPAGLASAVEKSGVLGTVSGLGTLVPRALSEGYKSRRLVYERNYASQLGAVGSASRLLDNLSSLRNLMTLPGYLAHTAGFGSGLLKHTPRTEHLLTGTAFNVAKAGKAGVAGAQDGIVYPEAEIHEGEILIGKCHLLNSFQSKEKFLLEQEKKQVLQ